MTTWKRTTEARYWEMLEMLPPAVQTADGFLVGEAMDHNPQGWARFTAFVEIGDDDYYEATEPLTVKEFRRVTPEIVLANVVED